MPLPSSRVPPDGTFRRLPTEAVTTAIEASEDGKLLFAAHQDAGKVTVWDLHTGKLLKTLEASEPRALLCRAGKLFVGSNSKPVIQVFAEADDWKLGDELKVGGAPIIKLTAARGAAFQNQLIVNTLGQKNIPVQYALDAGKDKFQQVTAGSSPRLSMLLADLW